MFSNENLSEDQKKKNNEFKSSNIKKVIINGEVIENPRYGFSLSNKGNYINMDIIVSDEPKKNE